MLIPHPISIEGYVYMAVSVKSTWSKITLLYES